MEIIMQPWPWYVSGPLIAIVMLLLILNGKSFGVSSNFRAICGMCGGGQCADFFVYDWKKDIWNLVFILGALIGGFIAAGFLTPDPEIALNPQTINDLKELNFKSPGTSYLPSEIYGMDIFSSFKGILILVVSGFLIGFGTRYAGGCTSGHAISGLCNLQIPSLIAVVGFFIGGLVMTHFLIPLIFG